MRLQDWLLLACVQGLSLQGVRIFPLWREKVKWMNATSPKYEEVTSWVNKASPSSRCPSLVSSFSQQTMEQHENKLYLHIFLEKKKRIFFFVSNFHISSPLAGPFSLKSGLHPICSGHATLKILTLFPTNPTMLKNIRTMPMSFLVRMDRYQGNKIDSGTYYMVDTTYK